jgi:hypothetical protein
MKIKQDFANVNSNPQGKKKKRGRGIYIFLLLIILIGLFLFFLAPHLSTGLKITLNEMEIRYDTFSVSFSDTIPEWLEEEVWSELKEIEHNGKSRFEFADEEGDIEIGLVFEENEALFEDFLIPVGHFYWIKNSMELKNFQEQEVVTKPGYGSLIQSVFEENFNQDINVVENEDVLSYLEDREGNAIGLITFSELSHEYQVLYLDNKYFFDEKEGSIPFSIGVRIKSAPEFLSVIVENNITDLYTSAPSLDEVAKINMSGVTALSRGLASRIEASGNNAYPAELIADFLGDADIVHTSNEVSFVPGCTPSSSMSFCSHPKYIETLEAINANVIELTGNHNNDYGPEHSRNTIEMYKEREWDYYGGGLNSEDAREILFKEVKNSKIAFIGYNYYDTIYNNVFSLAGENRAGANSFSFEKMQEDIEEAKNEDALVIVTFQFQECYSYPPQDVIFPPCYKPLANPNQKEVFRTAVDYGADIVIGSQAHQPQTYEIYNDKLIFYGTGNIFFDQIQWIGTRQGLIYTHYVHNNRLLQSRITTTLYNSDMRPYVTKGEDRELLLRLLRDARE